MRNKSGLDIIKDQMGYGTISPTSNNQFVDLAEAKRSRQHNVAVYPDVRPETEESKKRGLRILHANLRKGGKLMAKPIVDLKTGKVTFPKEEATTKAAAEEVGYVSLPKATLDKLAVLARRDGFKADAETERGQANQTSKVCRVYVQLAIDRLLADRTSG